MYLKKITVKNVKCFKEIVIDFEQDKQPRLWTSLFGTNGLGKSTLLQAIGIALTGPGAIRELLPRSEGWVREGEPYGEIIAELLWTQGDSVPPIRGHGSPKTKSAYTIQYLVIGTDLEKLPLRNEDGAYFNYIPQTIVPWSGQGGSKQRENLTKDINRLQMTAYTENKRGWLACGYGPFRRLSGGSQDADKILYSGRIAARFITLFREDAALTSATEWLMRLHNTAREGDVDNNKALGHVKKAFTEDFFPKPIELLVSAREVQLQTVDKQAVKLQDLSDGYRSMLALGIDLLRWLIEAFPESKNPMNEPGVVLIDELDTHLHPQWQRYIGYWLREKFPKLQFIIATHSPFLAQVADVDEHGLISHNENMGQISGNIILEERDDGVGVHAYSEPVADLRIDQLLLSPLFDVLITSPKTEARIKEHEALYVKKVNQQSLSKEEEARYEQLDMWRENLPMQSDFSLRKQEQHLHHTISELEDQLQEIE
jgi:hypothetical protein